MVRWLEASDLHGIDNVQAVVDLAIDRGDLDAVFLKGDLADEEMGDRQYRYSQIVQEEQEAFLESDEAKELGLELEEKLSSILDPEEMQVYDTIVQVQQRGGIQALLQSYQHNKGTPQGELDSQLLMQYINQQNRMKEVGEKLDEHKHEIEEIENRGEQALVDRIGNLVRKDYKLIDNECGRLNIPCYAIAGNHDFPVAMDEFENIERLDTKTEAVVIKGVRFAGAPNVGRKDRAIPIPGFFEGCESLEPTDPRTEEMYALIDVFLEKHGDKADVRDFRRKMLAQSTVYPRLMGMGGVDVLQMHQPVGQMAYLNLGRNGGKTFMDYSYPLGEAIRELQPSVLGWGHYHGKKGTFVDDDTTFGYAYQGLHTTNNTCYVVDLDEDTKDINWLDIYRLVDAQDPNSN